MRWLLALLLLTGVAFAESQQPFPSNGKTESSQPQNQPAASQQPTENNQSTPDSATIVIKVLGAQKAEADSANKTKEQEKQPSTDWWMFGATVVLALIALLQLTAFVVQAIHLGQTVRAMNDTAQRQLRAYVGVGGENFRLDLPGEKDSHYTPVNLNDPNPQIFNDFVVLTVKNFGQTPAFDVVVFCHAVATEGASLLEADFFQKMQPDRIDPNSGVFTSRFTLQPQQSAESKSAILDVRLFSAARKRKKTIYLWGHIYYRDIYQRPWRTRYCYVWEPWHPPGARFVPYIRYNDEDQTKFE